MQVGERSVVDGRLEVRLSKERAIHIRSGESVDSSVADPSPLASHQRIRTSRTSRSSQNNCTRLQLRAHCMGLLRESGQVANKCRWQRPGDAALGPSWRGWATRACRLL
jgi:hypothetical protein